MGKRIKDLTSLSLPINDNDKILIERSDKSYNANISDILSTKQDTISDLGTIRSGAALGATALQSVPSEYITESELNAKKYLTAIPSEYVTESELSAKKYLTSVPSEYVTETELAKKQDTISDLDTIRSGATLGATALQAVPDTYVTETELTNKGYLTAIPSEYITETELTSKNFATVSGVDAKINALDATISGNSTHVTIKITEENGKLSSLNVTESDIASANALTAETKARTDADKALNDRIDTVSGTVTTIQNSVGENTSSQTLSERVNILENKCDKLDSKANVLWVGTSIPAGDIQFSNNGTTQSTTSDLGSNNYPKMVADALGFNLYNNSRGSSFACFYPSSDDGTSNWAGKKYTEYQNEVYKGYSLSASMAQVEEKFGPNGLNVPDWLLNSFKSYSYESLIIPYIDGTIASCDTVIIDHGYNDRQQILNQTSWHKGEGEEMVIGSGRDWLLTLQDPFEKTQSTESYFQGCWLANENDKDTKKYYWNAMIFLCKKIWNVNPRIQIIIGNYFTKKSDIFGSEFGNDRLGEFICLANTAIANWLQVKCVNVANYTGLYNRNLAAGKDFQIFCPDNVHPHSDSSGRSNEIIARIYINQLRGLV